jgi:hypothetical protein
MNNIFDNEFRELCKTSTTKKENIKSTSELVLNFLGHGFTMSELSHIASFAADLEGSAATLADADNLPEGSVFLVKVFGNEIQVSFAGLAKK